MNFRWACQSDLFRRTLVQVPDRDGRPSWAWTYVLAQPHDDAPLVVDGDWIAALRLGGDGLAARELRFLLPLGPGSREAETTFAKALLTLAVHGPGEVRWSDESLVFEDDDDGNDRTTGTSRAPWMGSQLCGEPAIIATLARRALGSLPGIEAIGEIQQVGARGRDQWLQGVHILGWTEWAAVFPLDLLGEEAFAEIRWEVGDGPECPPHAVEVELWWGAERMRGWPMDDV